MAEFADILRGLGSALNPQVAQQQAAEQQQQRGMEQQVGMLQLKQKLEDQSPEGQARIEALQNDKQFRLAVAGAGGDIAKIAGAAAQFGKPDLAVSLYNKQEERAARIQQAHDALALKEKELTQRAEDKAADRETRALAQAQLFELKKQGLALQGELARSNQDLKRTQFEMKADDGLRKNVQQLGQALEKANLPEADAVIGNVESVLSKNPKISEFISGPKSTLPDWMVSKEVTDARQAFAKLFNITLKNRSGSAVTNQELERLKGEFGAGAFKKPEQLQEAVDKARNIINKHYASVASGFGPDALNAYNENSRAIGGKVVIEPAQSAAGAWTVTEVKPK